MASEVASQEKAVPFPPPKEERAKLAKEFVPLQWSLSDIRAAIPAHLFVRNTMRGLAYLARDIIMAAITWELATYIDPLCTSPAFKTTLSPIGAEVLRWSLWATYWWFQGLIFTGIWVIGHESGHNAFSGSQLVCDIVGFITHTFLWTPYFSWKISHHRHHMNHASMERDEVYIPKTRSDFNLPKDPEEEFDYEEVLGDTPIYTLFMLVRQQVLAFPAYLLFNVSGQKHYPKWTNHFDPNSVIFTKEQRTAVMLSNAGILFMIWGVMKASSIWGAGEVIKYYGIPWLSVSHWFIMITYLHHTDPNLPHYRAGQWNFQRGAAATVDRDFLGPMGRFFLHDVAHFHVIHHFFPKLPFYHGEEATKYLKALIGEHYHYSNKAVFQTLWDNYNACQFVDDEGEVLFYRDRKGEIVFKKYETH